MPAEDHNELFKKLIFSLIKNLKARFEQELKKAKISITPLQYGVLAHLSKGGINLNDLAKILANKPPTLIPAIDHLEADGYLKREQDTEDRRKVNILITAKGLDIMKKIPLSKSSDKLKKAFNTLGKDKTEKLLGLLQELTDIIDK